MPLFGKLYDDTRGRLSRVLATVRREATGERPKKPVRLKLAGLAAPLRAVVRDESNGGILIEAELPWLTVGSTVQAGFTDGREKAGRVHWFGVDATRAGSARLRIFVDLSSQSGPVATELPDVGDLARRRSRWPWFLATAFVVVAASLALVLMLRRVKPVLLPSPVAAEPAPQRAPTAVAVPQEPPEALPADAAAVSQPAPNAAPSKPKATTRPKPKRRKR